MADPKVPGKPAADAAAPVEREIPSFTKVADDARNARTDELQTLAGHKPAAEAKPAADAKPSGEAPYDGRAEWEKLPENLRTWAVEAAYGSYNNALAEQYGDVIPLLQEMRENPNLRAALALAATDKDLRDLLADESFRKDFKKLTKTEAREFLFGPAYDTYTKYDVAPAAQDETSAVDKLRTDFENEAAGRVTTEYVTNRADEARALAAAFPQFDQSALGHVITYSEQQFENAALRAGIKTRDANGRMLDNWAGAAVRAGIKAPSYRDYGAQYAEIIGRGAPPAAPAGNGGEAVPLAAPRDPVEARNAGLRALGALKKTHPGFQPRGKR